MRSNESAITALIAEQIRTLGRPIARRSRSVFASGEHDQRRSLRDIFCGSVEDRHLLAVRQMPGDAAFDARNQMVAQANVGERAAHHHFVIAAARAVRVEVLRLDAAFHQILGGRARAGDVAGRRDVIGRHRVAEHGEHARSGNVAQCRRLRRHVVEVRRFLDVLALRIPVVPLAGFNLQLRPVVVAGEDVGIARFEHRVVDALRHRRRDLVVARPNLLEKDRACRFGPGRSARS